MNPNNQIKPNNVGTAAPRLSRRGPLAVLLIGVSDKGIDTDILGGRQSTGFPPKDLPYPCESSKSVAKKKRPPKRALYLNRGLVDPGLIFRESYFAETNECVIACTDSAMRFWTPTLRISLATCAFTVRSSIPKADPISLFERPATSISRTSFSRSVKVTRPFGKILPGEVLTRSMNIESTRRGAQTDPWLTMRMACTNSPADAASST